MKLRRKLPLHIILPVLGLGLFVVALFVVQRELRNVRLQDVRAYIEHLPALQLLCALAVIVANYAVLTGYDALAVRYLGRPLSYRRTALISFLSFSFSLNLGNALISGGSVRFRQYTAEGFSAPEITRLILFCLLGSWLGFLTLSGTLLLWRPMAPEFAERWEGLMRPLGAVLLSIVALCAIACFVRRKPLRVFSWELMVPRGWLILRVLAVSVVEWMLSATALYFLLPSDPQLTWLTVLEIFLLAQIVGVISQVPGGLGVFEAAVLLLLPAGVPADDVAGGLVLFRLLFFIMPLAVGAAAMAAQEVHRYRREIGEYLRGAGESNASVTPMFVSVLVFLGGAALLVAGVTPAHTARLHFLTDLLPHVVIEGAHFLAAIAGILIVLLGQALYRRVRAAYTAALVLLAAGALLALLRGAEYEEALVLVIVAAVLLPCRRHFTRQASLLAYRFASPWWAATGAVVAIVLWLGFFAYKHVEFSRELLFQFHLGGDDSRFLRGSAGVVLTALGVASYQLLRPVLRKVPAVPHERVQEKVVELVHRSRQNEAWLALLGDKQFFVDRGARAFLMHAQQGRRRIVLGDPVGPEEHWEDLLWDFREACDRDGAVPVFYQVREAHLYYYIDMGLSFLKLGEEGRVPLRRFTLEGEAREALRESHAAARRDGCTFELIEPDNVPAMMPELRRLSNAWLAASGAAEKHFSLGSFNEEYLRHFPCAVVWRGGRLIAFSNIRLGAANHELAPDMIRYDADNAERIMDFLLVELMQWGRDQGYAWISLGMSPLVGLQDRPYAEFWNRMGTFLFDHGGHFADFESLRRYKERFGPMWSGRYLAAPGGLSLGRTLLDVAALIGGGRVRLFRR